MNAVIRVGAGVRTLSAACAWRRVGRAATLPAFLVAGVIASLAGGVPLSAQTPSANTLAHFDSAFFAWDRGEYVQALERIERILTGPDAAAMLRPVAVLTGEPYRVSPLATDGRAAAWSPDGRLAAFESGTGAATLTHLVELRADGPQPVATLPGARAAFSPDGNSVALLRIPRSPELDRLREQEARALAARDGAALRTLRARIAELESTTARVVVHDLASGSETDRSPGAAALRALRVAFAGDGSLLLVAAPTGMPDRPQILVLPERGSPIPLHSLDAAAGLVLLTGSPAHVVFTIGVDRVGVHELATGRLRVLQGRSPALSADGSTMAYLAPGPQLAPELRRGEAATGADGRGSGGATSLMVLRLDGGSEPALVHRTTLPISPPAVSPGGGRIAYSLVLRDDWEVFVVNADGSGERRVTREIQHDLFPAFLSEDRLIAMKGEARHRRMYLYDLAEERLARIAQATLPGRDARTGTRLFHNNTLRTVAPQYEWVPGPDGTRILVVADRDGDTLSPERGVYLVDLTRPVTRDEVLARVRANLAAERDLRERGHRLFAPIEDAVRQAVAQVDVARVHDHAHALYQLGPKHVRDEGNRLAVEYLANALRRMGYEPELQWFEPAPGVRVANVVATLRGTADPGRVHVISSHFDSVEGSPGADDNSSGTTALLEAARVLAGRPQPGTIRFAFLNAEEVGLLGAREFVRLAQTRGDRIHTVLNNDMVGWTRSHRLDNTIRYSNAAIRDVQHAAAIGFSDLITYDSRYVRNTDAHVFHDAYGDIIGGIGSYPILGNPHYHQRHDILEMIDHRLVAEVAKTTVATLMLLANRPDLVGP
jgi:hypothetical protein